MVRVSVYHQKMSLVLWVLNEDVKECLKKKKRIFEGIYHILSPKPVMLSYQFPGMMIMFKLWG